MNSAFRVALVALLVSGCSATQVASAGPTFAPSQSTTGAAALPANSQGPVALAPGTYTAGDPFLVRATFNVRAGWAGNVGGPYFVDLKRLQSNAEVAFSIFQDVFADPCHFNKGLLSPPAGSSVDDLATALARIPGVTATAPANVSLGGYQGKQLTLTAPASFAGCTLDTANGFHGFDIWALPLGVTNGLSPSERDAVWVLDVGDQRLVIDTPNLQGQSTQDTAEIQGILGSIRLAAASPGASPSTP